MNKSKAQFVTGLIFLLLVVLAADVVALFPKVLPWILGVLAIPGAWWFCKCLFAFLTDDNASLPKLEVPKHKKRKKKEQVDFTKMWAGVPNKDGEA